MWQDQPQVMADDISQLSKGLQSMADLEYASLAQAAKMVTCSWVLRNS
jgi:hypothetical protein